MNVMRRTACLVVNPITVTNLAALFNFTPAGQVSDLMMTSAPKLSLDALSLVGPIGVQLLGFCCSSVSLLALLFSTHLVSSN